MIHRAVFSNIFRRHLADTSLVVPLRECEANAREFELLSGPAVVPSCQDSRESCPRERESYQHPAAHSAEGGTGGQAPKNAIATTTAAVVAATAVLGRDSCRCGRGSGGGRFGGSAVLILIITTKNKTRPVECSHLLSANVRRRRCCCCWTRVARWDTYVRPSDNSTSKEEKA